MIEALGRYEPLEAELLFAGGMLKRFHSRKHYEHFFTSRLFRRCFWARNSLERAICSEVGGEKSATNSGSSSMTFLLFLLFTFIILPDYRLTSAKTRSF